MKISKDPVGPCDPVIFEMFESFLCFACFLAFLVFSGAKGFSLYFCEGGHPPFPDPNLRVARRHAREVLRAARSVDENLREFAGYLGCFERAVGGELRKQADFIRPKLEVADWTSSVWRKVARLSRSAKALWENFGTLKPKTLSVKVCPGSLGEEDSKVDEMEEAPLKLPADGGLDLRCASSRLFVEMFGGENETPESSDGEREEIRPLEFGWQGGRQGSEGSEMSEGSSGSQGGGVEEKSEAPLVDLGVHGNLAPPETNPPFEDLDVDGIMGRPEWVGDPPEMDFGEVDDGGGVKDSPDSPENLEDRGWQVGDEWPPVGFDSGVRGSTTANAAPWGEPVGFALGRAQPIRRAGAVAWFGERPSSDYCGRGRGCPKGAHCTPASGYENI